MTYRIETIDGDGAVKELPTRYDDREVAIGVAEHLHDLEHRRLGVKGSNGVRIVDQDGKCVWERTTDHDYLGIPASTR